MRRLIFILVAVMSVTGQNPSHAAAPQLPGFDYTQGWLGADDAYSISLNGYTSLWLFGDTFVGNKDTVLRSQYVAMPRNSIAISVCKPGAKCTLRYFWKAQYTPKPRSFFDTGNDDLWYWPMDGYLDGKTLYVALMAVRNKPNAKPEDAFGFEVIGTKLATIENALLPPERWQISIQDLTDARLWAGTSIIPDGKYLLWYTHVSVSEGQGYMVVMRVPIAHMRNSSAAWEYLRKDNKWAAGMAGDDALHVIDQSISEMSVRYHSSIKKWVALSTGPEFPSPRVVARTADTPVGPWSSPQTIYEFPEMKHGSPGYDKDTFCYAVKEHVEFSETKIALTYACNSLVIAKTIANMNIYRPRPVTLALPQ